jgi:sec-independent protein translocase protein TatA
MPGNIGPLEIAIVLIIALLVFGPKRLPELGKSLGKGIREFKGSITGEHDDEKRDEQAQIKSPDPTPAPAASRADEKREAEVVRDKSA